MMTTETHTSIQTATISQFGYLPSRKNTCQKIERMQVELCKTDVTFEAPFSENLQTKLRATCTRIFGMKAGLGNDWLGQMFMIKTPDAYFGRCESESPSANSEGGVQK